MGSALGHGPANEGTGHWWSERITAIALVPLTFWLVYSLFTLAALTRAEAIAWMQTPANAVLMVLFLLSMFYHSFLGLQVITEDYVHLKWLKITTIIALQFAHVLLAATSVFMVLRLAFGGSIQ